LRRLGLIALLGAAACNQLEGPGYRGEPLFVITGQLVPMQGQRIDGQVRLALAWYRTSRGKPDSPPAIVTVDTVFEGSFPAQFELPLYAPPPMGTLEDYEPYAIADGVVIAYLDRNGNGQLDSIPTNGRAVDEILGASIPNIAFEQGRSVMYTEQTTRSPAPGTTDPNIPAGYSLYPPAPDAEVTITLTRDPVLNLWMCEQIFQDPQPPVAAGTPCAHRPDDQLHVDGTLEASFDGQDLVFFYASDGAHDVPGLAVRVNGTSVAAAGGSGAVVAGVVNDVEVSAAGFPATRFQIAVPGPFQLAPLAGTVRRGEPLALSWSPSALVGDYLVMLSDAEGYTLFVAETTATALTIPAIDHVGPAMISIIAAGALNASDGRSYVEGSYLVQQEIAYEL
jgi:hypothetical protein